MAATANFPTLTSPFGFKVDSRQFTETLKDPSMRAEMEGGYVISRARHTRRPTSSWTCSYRELPQADKDLLTTFYGDQRGGSLMFNWIHPESGVSHVVRFNGDLTWTYTGRGSTKLWDCSFVLEKV